MVDEAYMDMIVQGFAEEILRNELHPSWRLYYLSTRPVICKGAATTKCTIVKTTRKLIRMTGLTLNKRLMPGPKIFPKIMELMRFMTFECVHDRYPENVLVY